MSERQTVASLHTRQVELEGKQNAHEEVCAERYRRIDGTLDNLTRRHGRMEAAAWGILLAIVGWMAVQLWDGRNAQAPTQAAVVMAK